VELKGSANSLMRSLKVSKYIGFLCLGSVKGTSVR
jgi:hypothetical protein